MRSFCRHMMKMTNKPLILVIGIASSSMLVLGAIVFVANAGPVPQLPSPNKAAVLPEMAAAQQRAATSSYRAPKHYLPPPTSCPHTVVPGIFPYRPDGYIRDANLVNTAVVLPGPNDPHWYWIFAGAAPDDAQQGVFIVVRFFKNPCAAEATGKDVLPTMQMYHTAHRQGALTLIRVDGDTVIFRAASGSIGRFNPITGQFVSN
jgi:hypothetical protein